VTNALYDDVAQDASRNLTRRYSTSFSLAATCFPKAMRQHIYNIYGLVRLADEVVDTYNGDNPKSLLDALEQDVYQALNDGYHTNMIVHAFVLTAHKYGIGKALIAPFFTSMRMDIPGTAYRPKDYAAYIYGSAEVVGLMCLKVFCVGDEQQYTLLQPGASALGASFQKINFLRDMADDYQRLHRYYFPVGTYQHFNDITKQAIIKDIRHDLQTALPAVAALPGDARSAVAAATSLYTRLLSKLEAAPANVIKTQRIRVANSTKMMLFARAYITRGRYV
jgi:phytoene synthase